MKDPKCMKAGCPFKTGADKAKCTGTEGVLSAAEINKIIKSGGKVSFDEEAAVKIDTWDEDQWVSWDDAKTLKMKMDYANKRCLGGSVNLSPAAVSITNEFHSSTMVWAIDLDDGTLIEALGSNLEREKSELNPAMPNPWPGLAIYGSDKELLKTV
ncbi:hypothetical protein NW755_003142 [Fusarium falciforme]|uniref:chitinase n=1 Tax=Fusarium falciforme TaxID=195108 RepID=A0A9W8RF76_9HYPO|nr:hypothetical protein NW755_003142 [Fusarium falciforme]